MEKKQKEYDELKTQYDKVVNQIEANNKEMNKIKKESVIVKRFLKLHDENIDLRDEKSRLFKELKEQEWSSCKHILVHSDKREKSCGCIKCGLDNKVLFVNENYLSSYGKMMFSYLYLGNHYLEGKTLGVCCDMELAQAIYRKIKEVHPEIDDETACKYFETALDDIQSIEVSEERKESRAQRLSLKSGFKSWN